MQKAYLNPTPDQSFEIIAGEKGDGNFSNILALATQLQEQGKIEEACNIRFQAIQQLQEILPEDEDICLEWNHANSRSAIELVNNSAIDHFLINDFEIASALLELSLDIDPEDHLESSVMLAYCYLALNEYELFDEVINDVSDKYASHTLLLLWSSFLREGVFPQGELRSFKSRFAKYYAEFTSSEHPADQQYLSDIEGEKPSIEAQARELWLRTENLWAQYPEFIEQLKATTNK